MRSRRLLFASKTESFLSGPATPALRYSLLAGWLLSTGCLGGDTEKELLTSTEGATPAECAQGGKAVLSGLDENDNGKLDASEVVERTVLCAETKPAAVPPEGRPPDPKPEETDPVQRVRVDAEAPGENCAHGGSAVSMGPDLDADGVLSDEEVEHTEFTCDDALVSRIKATLEGEECAGEGVLFELGRDRDQSGTLEDGEVEWSELECGDVVAHDITIQSADELEAIQNIRVIEGNLSIYDTDLARVELPKLEMLGGDLHVAGNEALEALRTPLLTLIGEGVDIHGNDALVEIDFAALERIGEELTVYGHPKLTQLSHDSLNYLGGDLTIRQNGGITRIDLSLFSGMGDALVAENPNLQTVSISVRDALGATDTRLGNLGIWNNATLSQAGFSADELGEVSIRGSAGLKELSLSAAAAESLYVEGSALSTLYWGNGDRSRFAVERSVSIEAPITFLNGFDAGGDVTIKRSRLESLTLGRVGRDVHVGENPRLKALSVGEPLGSVTIKDNDALQTTWVGHGFDPVVVHGSLTIEGNDALENLAGLQHLTSIGGSLYIRDNKKLVRTHLFALESVQDVSIYQSPALKWLDFGDVTALRWVTISGTAIEKLEGLASLRFVDSLTIEENPALYSISLPALVSADLQILGNPLLITLELPALKQGPRSYTAIRDNAQLPVCAVDQLFSRIEGTKEQAGNLGESCPTAP